MLTHVVVSTCANYSTHRTTMPWSHHGTHHLMNSRVTIKWIASIHLVDLVQMLITGGRLGGTVQASAPYTEQMYATVGGINTATPVSPFAIRLSRFKNTILSMKKAFLFPDVILLRVVWGPGQKFLSTGTACRGSSNRFSCSSW